ncbi:MAG: EutN/CcmL family microcompartment protein [Thermoleophilia bacterium]|nr:EutN/CcmL family microcompartment protein [Thermoleophilia bacterium]
MDVCRVVGQAVSTAKDEGLHGTKLLLVRAAGPDGAANGPAFAATDTVGAGEGELVLVARGSAARTTGRTGAVPTDAAIVAILDSLTIDGKVTYHKE